MLCFDWNFVIIQVTEVGLVFVVHISTL